jgi:hypothetical protein
MEEDDVFHPQMHESEFVTVSFLSRLGARQYTSMIFGYGFI